MAIFDFLKKKNKVGNDSFKFINGLSYEWPNYGQFGNDIYNSDVVQQALNCIVREMKKLEPIHVKHNKEGGVELVEDEIQRILRDPNPLMTTSDFIEKIVWTLFFNYNAFVVPHFENNKIIGLYPIQPSEVSFIQDDSGSIFVQFYFSNNYQPIIRYSDVIHIRYNFSVSEFMGGDKGGQPNHDPLLKTLKMNESLLQGVEKALNSTFAINGVVKYNSMIDNGKTEKELKKLTDALRNNESGLMGLDMKGEFIPFKRDVKLVEGETLRFIDEKILRNFGVSLPILTGDYTKSQYEAFFQKVIEPLVISFSQAFTKCIFTRKEISGIGHRIIFSHKELDFMTMQEKIQWMTFASNVGAITVNEIRSIMGYPPCHDEKLGNTYVMSKNFGDALAVKDEVKGVDKIENMTDNENDKKEEGEDVEEVQRK